MKVSRQRSILRTFHLVGAGIIGTYIYSPWGSLEWFTLLNQVVVVPLLSLSGIWMWKGQKIQAAFKSGK